MNIQRDLSKSLQNPVAKRFVESLNKQESTFRKCLSSAYRDRNQLLKMVSVNPDLRSSIGQDVLTSFDTRPTLVFSTDVTLTKQQKKTMSVLSGWHAYALVYNIEEQCAAVLIKNHLEGSCASRQDRGVQTTVSYQSFGKTQKWGMVYPDGSIRTGEDMPISACGKWKAVRRLKSLPKETPKDAIKRAQSSKHVADGVKRGLFSISTK